MCKSGISSLQYNGFQIFIFKQLVMSRVVILAFQMLVNWLVADFQTDALLASNSHNYTNLLADGLSRWDAQHFLQIAQFGYVSETDIAFFPLFPMVLRFSADALRVFYSPQCVYSSLLIGGVIINNILFIINGYLLYRLVTLITEKERLARTAVLVFSWSPASIFFSSLYSESLYFSFTLAALIHLYQRPDDRWNQLFSSFIFSFAYLTRSIGLLNLGYIAFQLMCQGILIKNIQLVIWNQKALNEPRVYGLRKYTTTTKEFEKNIQQKFHPAGSAMFSNETFVEVFRWLTFSFGVLAVAYLIFLLPLKIFESSIWQKFCAADLTDDKILMPLNIERKYANNFEWCSEYSPLYPLPVYYREVQRKYWGVRLFGHWQIRKLPYFFMSFPTLFFVIYGSVAVGRTVLNDPRPLVFSLFSHKLIPFALHNLFLIFSAFFVYNVEVVTRIIFSASPFIYIVIARIIVSHSLTSTNNSVFLLPPNFRNPLVLFTFLYIFIYCFVGTALHVNWLPYI